MKTQNVQFYYLFRCDDNKRPNHIKSDEYFDLADYKRVEELKSELDSQGVHYDLLIERFDETTDSVLSNDYIVENNYVNA